MLSRPLVGAWLAASLVGAPLQGALVGALLELYLLAAVPSGAGRHPEPGPAAVVAGATAAAHPDPGGLMLAVTLGLVLGWVGARTQAWQRTWLGRRLPPLAQSEGAEAELRRRHLSALVLDAARGAILTLGALVVAEAAAPWFAGLWPLGEGATLGVLLPGAFVSLGIVARGLQGATRWPQLAGGLALGLLVGRWMFGGGLVGGGLFGGSLVLVSLFGGGA
jgi:mannose/fructose/N-acetylgalactosamine-specific phosphotransferase system component IIC